MACLISFAPASIIITHTACFPHRHQRRSGYRVAPSASSLTTAQTDLNRGVMWAALSSSHKRNAPKPKSRYQNSEVLWVFNRIAPNYHTEHRRSPLFPNYHHSITAASLIMYI
ncbi:unnamed protein product [Parnassius mnemosyne]|uniref:Secreted protein n=1 Tax=Parnassius mnemosyne TaxID=213953 RepID=A0AAV1L560_9NEOP